MHVAARLGPSEARAAIAAIARTDELMRWAADFADRPVKVILLPVRSRDGDFNVPWHVHDVLALSHGTCQPATGAAIGALEPMAGQGDISPFGGGSATLRAQSRSDAARDRDIAAGDAALRAIGMDEIADRVLEERRSRGKSRDIYAPRTPAKWAELMEACIMLDPAFQSAGDGVLAVEADGHGGWSALLRGEILRLGARALEEIGAIAASAPRCSGQKTWDGTMRTVARVTARIKRDCVDAYLAERAGRQRL